jgi:hypothetical protein
MWCMQCNVGFEYQLSICSRTEENFGRWRQRVTLKRKQHRPLSHSANIEDQDQHLQCILICNRLIYDWPGECFVIFTPFPRKHNLIHNNWLSKSKSRYERRSVGQSVLVSGPMWGPRPDFCYCQTVTVLSKLIPMPGIETGPPGLKPSTLNTRPRMTTTYPTIGILNTQLAQGQVE